LERACCAVETTAFASPHSAEKATGVATRCAN